MRMYFWKWINVPQKYLILRTEIERKAERTFTMWFLNFVSRFITLSLNLSLHFCPLALQVTSLAAALPSSTSCPWTSSWRQRPQLTCSVSNSNRNSSLTLNNSSCPSRLFTQTAWVFVNRKNVHFKVVFRNLCTIGMQPDRGLSHLNPCV